MRFVVSGARPESKEASVAGDKLLRAGFTDIWEFACGLEEWPKQGLATEGKPTAQVREQPIIGSFLLGAEKSVIKWTGANLTNSHAGALRFTGGALRLGEGQLEDAKFQIDMKSLACEDIKDAEVNQMLVRHLSSDGFFTLDNLCQTGGIRVVESHLPFMIF
jgi:hypothetical protein